MINRNVFADASFFYTLVLAFIGQATAKINIDDLAGLWLLMKVLEKLLRIVPERPLWRSRESSEVD